MLEIVNNKTIIVPPGIRYISQWKDYSLKEFQFPHILDKKIPGCGYTEYCITCDIPIILCSPRRILLENKEEQHNYYKDPNTKKLIPLSNPEFPVFYFKNELEAEINSGKDLTKISRLQEPHKDKDEEIEEKKQRLDQMKQELENYISYCGKTKHVPKILVTYDSFRLVKEILESHNWFHCFQVVIDEFQSVFVDSKFKSDTELDFVYQIQGVQHVCYVSATPMIEDYLKELPEFKDLPYYELDWYAADKGRVISPDLKARATNSITTTACEVIKTYKDGEFDKAVFRDSFGNIQEIISTEAVLYVNSVNNIISIILKAGLTADECNILCSNTYENAKKIKTRLGKTFEIGKVPLRGESHKMFTFCTRTVYLGADFYSLCAKTFIFSDANIDSLAVDITLDLPQILGRQRLLENPWKNRAQLWYKTLGDKKIKTKEEFDKVVQDKLKKTQDLLNSYHDTRDEAKKTVAETYQYVAKTANYKDNYVAVNMHAGKTLVPVVNTLVKISEQRAFDIQQIDYKNRFSVFNSLAENSIISKQSSDNIQSFLNYFNNTLSDFLTRMKAICEAPLSDSERSIILDQVPIQYKQYYTVLGPEKLRAVGYNVTKVKEAFCGASFNSSTISDVIYKNFEIGKRYTKVEIKDLLGKLYKSINYNASPKASDLEQYFELRHCQILNKETGKKDHGFEIISKKL